MFEPKTFTRAPTATVSVELALCERNGKAIAFWSTIALLMKVLFPAKVRLPAIKLLVNVCGLVSEVLVSATWPKMTAS